jgi:hypothetical protein
MRFILAMFVTVLITGAYSETVATEIVAEAWRATYLTACPTLQGAADNCTLCHDSQSNALNPYALDIQTEQLDGDKLWSFAIPLVEGDDSDGDGDDNGTEIDNCTLPGDALNVSVEEQPWGNIKTLYR